MKDMTHLNSEENKFEARVVRSQADLLDAQAYKTEAEARQVEAEAKKEEAKRKLKEAKSKGHRSTLKRTLVGLGIGASLVGGGIVTYQAGKGIKKSFDNHPDAIENTTQSFVDGALETVQAAGKTVQSVGKTFNTTIERVDRFISRPDWSAFLKRIENSSGRFGTRTLQANSWTRNHPDTPVTKDQLNALLQARKEYAETHNGRPMPEKELAKITQEICRWKNLPVRQRQNDGR